MGLLQPHGRGRGPCGRAFLREGDARDYYPRVYRRTGKPVGGARAIIDGGLRVVIIVHSLGQAIAALTAAAQVGRPVVLASAPDAGGYTGPGWFGGLISAAREAVPDARFSAL